MLKQTLSSFFLEKKMDLLEANTRQIYLKYLFASLGGAILPSVYGLVDMIVVGKYHGPAGAAAMAIIVPIWTALFSSGLLTGIGASILFSANKISNPNKYFTIGLLLTSCIASFLWLSLVLFEDTILYALGADEILFPLVKSYLIPVKFSVPIFLFMLFMAAFLRNDNNPMLSTKAVIYGGVFNIFGDVFFVFTLDMGILGAGLATCLGALISLLVMLTHFRTKENTLRIVKVENVLALSRKIIVLGFPSFFVDIAVGILTVLFNLQIMKYLGSDSLAVYGIIVNIVIFVQCCAYGIGQASQPLLSVNYGAGKISRIKEIFRYNIISVAIVSIIWLISVQAFPNTFVHIFMATTDTILEITPSILRTYSLSFLLLPFNIYATYYFQSIMKAQVAFAISVARGLFMSGFLILLLPILFGGFGIWMAMPIAELLTFVGIVFVMKKSPLEGE